MPTNAPLNRKLRMGRVGGGQGSFIGRVHATGATLDNRAAVVAGALSGNPERAKSSASDYDIPPERAYTSYAEMASAEAKRPDKIDFASIATPNHTHFDIAKTFLAAGFNVVCDKPMTYDLAQAEELVQLVEQSGAVFAVMHNYTGYPMVRQAREMILNGDLGDVNAIRSNYTQGWLRTRLETDDQKQAKWRTDPKSSGIAGCFGDIGTHAYNLGRYMTGLLPTDLSAHLRTFVEGRELDDYGTAIIKFENGALGTVTASQISHGRENDVRIEIDGTEASIEWHQENPNLLFVRKNGEAMRTYTRNGGPYLGQTSTAASRLPAGHPEGFFEAFANVYASAMDNMVLRESGNKFETKETIYPNVYDGAEGMLFITQCVKSSQEGGAWLPFRFAGSRR